MARVTTIICPCCHGGKKRPLLGFCFWCDGSLKVSSDKAFRYANQVFTLAVGGYVCGDHDWKTRCEMIAEADKVCELLQVPRIEPKAPRI